MEKGQTASTQQFVDIEDIKDGTVILKNGSLRRILMVSGINFDLKSEEEQNIVSYSFQNFLNTLDFTIQFLIHSRKMNIENYIAGLQGRMEKEENELMKNQIGEYIEFTRSFVAQNAVMAKAFFAVVPYDAIQIPKAGTSLLSSFSFLGGAKKTQAKNEGLEQKISQLNQRTEEVINGLTQIGLRAVALNDEELIELFYNLYNPAGVEKQEIKIAASH